MNLNEKYGDCYFSYDNNFLNQEDVNKVRNMHEIDDSRMKIYGNISSDDSGGNYENDLNSSKFHNNDGNSSVDNNNNIYDVNNSKDLGIQEINEPINEDINEPKVMRLDSFLKGINSWNDEQISTFYEKNSRDLHNYTHKISDIDDAHIKTFPLYKDINGSDIHLGVLEKGGNEGRSIVDLKKTKKNHEKMLKYSPNPPYIFDSTFDFGESEPMSQDYTVPSIFNGTISNIFFYAVYVHTYMKIRIYINA